MKRIVYFITSNKIKVDFARKSLKKFGIEVKKRKFDFKEIQEIDVQKVAIHKANQIANVFNKDFMVDDSGFYINALKGFPGALLKPVSESLGINGLCKFASNKTGKNVQYASTLVFFESKKKKFRIFNDNIKGKLPKTPRGRGAKGLLVDRMLIPYGYKKTIAELGRGELARFWEEFRKNQSYEKLGRWLSKKRK